MASWVSDCQSGPDQLCRMNREYVTREDLLDTSNRSLKVGIAY